VQRVRNVYDFITGGSVVAPIGLALAIVAALVLPSAREAVFVTIVAGTLVASAFEKPN
jgi:hypothetical protein